MQIDWLVACSSDLLLHWTWLMIIPEALRVDNPTEGQTGQVCPNTLVSRSHNMLHKLQCVCVSLCAFLLFIFKRKGMQ